jgi:hypothetical protein
MSQSCDKLREEAMRQGEGSAAEYAWIRHSRTCKNCQTELFVLETLRRQAANDRMHLPRKQIDMLMQTARQQYQPRKRPSFLSVAWGVTWKLAILAACAFVLIEFIPQKWASASELQKIYIAHQSLPEPTEAGNYFLPVHPVGSRELEQAVICANTPQEACAMPELLPGQSVDRAIRELRSQVDLRRTAVLEQIDHDLTRFP